MSDPFVLPDAEWRDRAACRPYPAVLFFGVDDTETPAEKRVREEKAKEICAVCSVRAECLEFAIAMKEPYGIWGGLTEVERKSRSHRGG